VNFTLGIGGRVGVGNLQGRVGHHVLKELVCLLVGTESVLVICVGRRADLIDPGIINIAGEVGLQRVIKSDVDRSDVGFGCWSSCDGRSTLEREVYSATITEEVSRSCTSVSITVFVHHMVKCHCKIAEHWVSVESVLHTRASVGWVTEDVCHFEDCCAIFEEVVQDDKVA